MLQHAAYRNYLWCRGSPRREATLFRQSLQVKALQEIPRRFVMRLGAEAGITSVSISDEGVVEVSHAASADISFSEVAAPCCARDVLKCDLGSEERLLECWMLCHGIIEDVEVVYASGDCGLLRQPFRFSGLVMYRDDPATAEAMSPAETASNENISIVWEKPPYSLGAAERHDFAFLLGVVVGKPGDLAPVPHLLAGVGRGTGVGQAGRAGTSSSGAFGRMLVIALEEPRLVLPESLGWCAPGSCSLSSQQVRTVSSRTKGSSVNPLEVLGVTLETPVASPVEHVAKDAYEVISPDELTDAKLTAGSEDSSTSSLSSAPLGDAAGAGAAPVRIVRASDGRVATVPSITCSLGRSSTCDLQFGDNTNVSRLHVMVCADAGGITIIDQGSANGTFVRGRRVDPQVPHHVGRGEYFRLADEDFRVE